MFKDLMTLDNRQKSRKRMGKLFRRKVNQRLPTREYEPFSSNVSPVALERKNIDLSMSLHLKKDFKKVPFDPTKKVEDQILPKLLQNQRYVK